MITCSKTYSDIPFAHRQHRHAGHCSFIHGHNWALKITFACENLDNDGFVVDFGNLRYLKRWIAENLDHACLLASDDPAKERITAAAPEAYKIYEVPNASCEGISLHLWEVFSRLVMEQEMGRVWIAEVVLREDSKNEAAFRPTADHLRSMRDAYTS